MVTRLHFFKSKVSLQRAPDSYPQARSGSGCLFRQSPSSPLRRSPRPPPRIRVGKEKEAPTSAWEERGARRQPAGSYLGSKACPRRGRRRRPQLRQGGPGERVGGRAAGSILTASAAPRPAGLPPSAAPVGTALCPGPSASALGWDPSQAPGWKLPGAGPPLLGLSRLAAGERRSRWAGRYF